MTGIDSRSALKVKRSDRRQEQLEQTAEVVGRVAHDYGNVLTGILGFTELALTQLSEGSVAHQYVSEIHFAALQGSQLTDQLRMFSRRGPVQFEPTQLAIVAAQEEARLRPAWDADAGLEIRLPADLPAVAMSAVSLGQVLGRLLDNAREAFSGPGKVVLSAGLTELAERDCAELLGNPAPGSHIEVIVTDTGKGLTPEAGRRVLKEAFFTTKPRRRGLGLAVVYGLLHAHRGGLALESGAEGGTVVRVFLPVAQVTPPCARASERVLVVDDDPLIRQLVCGSLRSANFQVQAAGSVREALDVLSAASATEPFDVVVADVLMPHLTGIDLARRLHARDPRIKVLLMSGNVNMDFTHETFAEVTFDLLPKPFQPEELLKAVRATLQRGGRPESSDSHRPSETPCLAHSR